MLLRTQREGIICHQGESPQEKWTLLVPWYWISGLQNHEKLNSYSFKSPSLWCFVMVILGNEYSKSECLSLPFNTNQNHGQDGQVHSPSSSVRDFFSSFMHSWCSLSGILFFFFFFLWGGGFCGAPCGEFLQQVSCLSKYKLLQHQSTRVNNRFNAGLLCWILIFLSFLASKDFPLFITSEAIMLKSGVVWCGVEWWW